LKKKYTDADGNQKIREELLKKIDKWAYVIVDPFD
jgi:hypothetical protein